MADDEFARNEFAKILDRRLEANGTKDSLLLVFSEGGKKVGETRVNLETAAGRKAYEDAQQWVVRKIQNLPASAQAAIEPGAKPSAMPASYWHGKVEKEGNANAEKTVLPAKIADSDDGSKKLFARRSDGTIKWNGMHERALLGAGADGGADAVSEYSPIAPTLAQLNSFRQYARDAQGVEKELLKLYPAEKIDAIMCTAYTAARDFLANKRAGSYEEQLFFNDSEGYRVGELVNKVALSYLWHVYAKGNDTNNAFLSGISRAVIGGTLRTDYLDVGDAQESKELSEMMMQADQISTDRRFGRSSRSDVRGMRVALPQAARPLAALPDISGSLGKEWTSPYYLADPAVSAALDKIEQRNITLELRVIDRPECPAYFYEEKTPDKTKTKNVLKIAGRAFAKIGKEVAGQFYTPSAVLAAEGNRELSEIIDHAVAAVREGNPKKFDMILDAVVQYEKSGLHPTTAPEAAAGARRWEAIALIFEGIEKSGLLGKKPALAGIWKEKLGEFASVPQSIPQDMQYKKFASKEAGIANLRKIAADMDKPPMAIAR